MSKQIRDSIPRVHKIVAHSRDQLIGIADGRDRFDDSRLLYSATAQRLAMKGEGRVIASRIPERDRNWAGARDVLAELMRWGALRPASLPSERRFLDRYRDARYELTDLGRHMADLARDDRAAFTDAITQAIIDCHPLVRSLLEVLADGTTIAYPFVNEGDVARGRRDGRKLPDWAAWATERIAGDASVAQTTAALKHGLDRLRGREGKPSDEELARVMSEELACAGFGARGLVVDHNTIKALLKWSRELLLWDSSRHVPAHPHGVVLWGCSDVTRGDDGAVHAARRGLAAHGHRVAQALVDAYRDLADADDSKLAAPFIAVHRVRAHVACQTGVTRALVDRVLSGLLDGEFPDIKAQTAVFVGATVQLPDSEPAFRHHGSRRLVMQVTSTHQGGTYGA